MAQSQTAIIPTSSSSLTASRSFIETLQASDKQLVNRLIEADQAHLFSEWDAPGTKDEEKLALLAQLRAVENSYPSGLGGYIENARALLADAKSGKNPFEGYTPHQPETVDLTQFRSEYDACEALAMGHLDKIGVVLVAGGLGERLGCSGIKLDLPVETLQGTTYLAHYASVLRAMEARMPEPRPVPLIIMTSDDTQDRTLHTLESNGYFGLSKTQVHLLKQEPVPAVSDNDARLALDSKYHLQTKPHGHGDIHMLLHGSGLAKRLAADGIEHLLFIQDTNGQVFNAAFAAIGASIREGFDFNSVAVKRIPGEAVGAITRLVKGDEELTINVEYNQLEPLLRATVSPEGDVPDAHGYSLFPGNINVLVLRLSSYAAILERTRGIIAEFVNPKYADEERTRFKKPARIESLMQDLPKLFGPSERVGVTVFERTWCFSAVKNNTADAAAKQGAGGPPESAASGEHDFFAAGRSKLEAAGWRVKAAPEEEALGIRFVPGPRVILRPSFALSLAEIRSKLSGGLIEDTATLILDGNGIELRDMTLKGHSALVVRAGDGATIHLENLDVSNAGFERVPLSNSEHADPATPEWLKIRGYRFVDRGAEIHAT